MTRRKLLIESTLQNWALHYLSKIHLSPPGANSDLLIHEATFEDDLEDLSKQKRHSTVSQAIEAGRNMGANFTILTHFSRRYSEIPEMEDCPENVGIAFDFMTVSTHH